MAHRPFRSLFLSAGAAVLFSSLAAAQTYYFAPSDTPTTGTCNVFPWGQASTRHQHIVTAAELGNARQVINDIGYAACATGTLTAGSILIRMNHFTGTTLAADFTANLGTGAVTMLSATNWSYAYSANAWADVGLTGSFNYDPALGNLIIDIEMCNATGGSSFHRDVASRHWLNAACPQGNVGTAATGALKVRVCTGTGGSFTPFGTGCGSPALAIAGSGTPNIGQAVSVQMTSGLANSPGIYIIGAAPTSIDLTGLGAPGCTLYTQPLVTIPTVFDGSGNAAPLPLNIPNNNSLVGASLTLTGLDVNPGANTLGLTTANGLTMTIGV